MEFNFSNPSFGSFSFGKKKEDGEKTQEKAEKDFLRTCYWRPQPIAYENALQMARDIDPSKDYFAFVSGSFIFGDLVEAMCDVHDIQLNDLYLVTLGMGQNNVDSIINLIRDHGCKHVNLIVSKYFMGVERHKMFAYLMQETNGYPVDVGVCATHAKICVMEWDGGAILMHGSANLSSNNSLEQFAITHDGETIEHVKSVLNEIMSKWTVFHGIGAETIFSNRNTSPKKLFEAVKEAGEREEGEKR